MSDIGDMGLTLHLLLVAVGLPMLVAPLAAWRVVRGHGPARLWALAALVAAILPLAFIFGDASPGSFGDAYMSAIDASVRRVGWPAYALPISGPLLLSGLVRGRATRWVDRVHLTALAGLAVLGIIGA